VLFREIAQAQFQTRAKTRIEAAEGTYGGSAPLRSQYRSGAEWPGFGVSSHNSCCKNQ